MKVKVIMVDLAIPPRVKKWGLRIGIPVAVLLGSGAIAYAAGLVTWSDGQKLVASDLNANFSYLESQIMALQAESHPASAFRAVRTTAMNIPSGSSTKVAFDTVLYDVASEYNATTGVFTPKNAGIYAITCAFMYSTPGTSAVFSALILQGTTELDDTDLQSNGAIAGASNGVRPEVTAMANLSAGQSVTCLTYQSSGSTQGLYLAQQRTTFSAARVN